MQLDAVFGCPELAVPADHLARAIVTHVARFDLSSVESTYSSLGRHGYSPRHMIAVLIYASLIGLHESTKIARALKTDTALRLLSGGHAISEGTLRRFRRTNVDLFQRLLEQTVKLADEAGLLKVDELAIDSWRLRADASSSSVGTVSRSTERLKVLATVDTSALSDAQRERHDASLKKHREIVEDCQRSGRTNLVRTSPSAGLMKFPYGASAPGHRVTVTAAGATERLVVSVLIDATPTDHGHLGQAVEGALRTLSSVGACNGRRVRAAADSGYWSEPDILFAANNVERIDLVVPDPNAKRPVSPYFERERFEIKDGVATCPAGTKMHGPVKDGGGVLRYYGVGCTNCPLRTACTASTRRTISIRPGYEAAMRHMQQRLKQADAIALYKKRLPTIEAVFSNIEDTMGYRRATARVERSVLAEVLLKLVAHNVSRLLHRRALERLVLVLDVDAEF